ncbi:polyadenylate-binding protein 2 [Phtheirospermum japonicum]|uniref:Polyadenylate-binding protein 2 n=1 Tax=Phtheirospermum japonicum TaxID=374723 RepID=A0A830BH18_9LAMI|nr:polyadenylate-binding protein 2 [Phtheirospermum japonicum]
MDYKGHRAQHDDVYGGDLPEESYMESDFGSSEMAAAAELKAKELENMKKRLQEIEEEAGALREQQAKVEKEIVGATEEDPIDDSAAQAEKEEIDSRSIYVGNVDYACTPEEVQQHFQSCGTVNRVTILTDKFGQPKGFAYVEFVEVEAVQNALLLNESELHGRQLKVSAKRTNIPGMRQFRGRRPNPYFGARGAFMAPVYSPYGAFRGLGVPCAIVRIDEASPGVGMPLDRGNQIAIEFSAITILVCPY